MKNVRLVLIASLLAFAQVAFAQTGKIRGTTFDRTNGEPMWGVQVFVVGTQNGAAADFDGKFELTIAPGTYTIQAKFVGTVSVKIENVVVKAGEVTVLDAIWMEPAVSELEDIVVTAEAIKTTDIALLTAKRKSTNLIDGISSQQIKRSGDSDVAGAIKRVPGVSIQGGQYVFVRGLGDRYTKTILNGVEVPGLDPDRNAIQIDIFPTSLIDNIIVYKNFTPDLSADFVGGTVNIETKDFPEEKTMNLSFSVEYNPSMHLRNDFLGYQGGGTDFLGFDDGTRDLPFDGRTGDIPSPILRDPVTESITRSFNPTMATQQESNFANISLGFSIGDQIDWKGKKLGYIGAINYNNTSTFYEQAVDGASVKPTEDDDFALISDTRFQGALGIRDAQLSGLAGLSLKSDKNKYRFQAMHIQNGTERAAQRTRVRSNNNFNTAIVDNLEYTERFLTNFLIAGEHYFNGNESQLEWKVSPTFSTINDKDIRITPFTIDDGLVAINPQEGGEPNRIWRLLTEQNYVAKVDYTKNYAFRGRDAKFKVGASNIYKTRDYEIQNYVTQIRGNQGLLNLDSDPDRLFAEENIWTADRGTGVYIQDNFNLSNAYEGRINITGAYAMSELALSSKLKTILGLRVEQYDQWYTGVNQAGANPNDPTGRVFNDDKVLSSFEFFPSVNFIYNVFENSNLRASYARTIARPSFKEKSTAEIQDVLTGRTFIGNIDLVETNIENFDIRWEYFFGRGETISIGAFYKDFTNPIELVRSDRAANDFSPQNVGNAEITGVELEIRKNLAFITPALENLSFISNITVTDATVNLTPLEQIGRINGLRTGEDFSLTRDFVGQPPYIVNASFAYTDFENFWEASVSYNVQGRTLAVVGVNRTPDTYNVPFNSLNVNLQKSFGMEGEHTFGLRINNILGDLQEREFESFGSANQIETRRDPGTSFRLKYSYNFLR
ncbi:TonB-dependent receptor [Roseivirga misakiensis]|uniref:TonB-dependent receptor n=1 Tax=Roseivirga misakiensis TaxID=1563681 RepID=A0A1E5T6L6_9BACT|nr:TonB-dependent receptor [Roseivirga misakiensis]OEK07025.1 hypothetical protein BFP71_05040 [Roseivirga misakiensis]